LINICRSASSLRVVARAWAYGSIVWGILLFVGLATGTAALTGRTTKDASRTMLTFGDPNVAANFLFISIMVIWATQIPRHRSLRLTGYALLVAAMVTTGSNSGLVSIIVGVMVAGFLGLYRRAGAVAAVTMICFALCGLYAVGSNINLISIQDRAQASRWSFIRDGIGRQESSVEQRGSILHESLHLYQVGGPFGAGPASTKPRLQAEQAPFVKEAHDDYLAALTERGLIGLLGVALLVGGVALQAIALVRRRLTPDFAAVIVRPNALVGAIAGTLLTMTVVELLHARHVWTLFAVVAALSLWGGDRVAHKTRKRT
jgi:O-antigen ligase